MATERMPEATAQPPIPSVYQKSPLDPKTHEIRLLQAKKRVVGTSETLLTRMITMSLLDPTHPPYKALSYVWFDSTPIYDPQMVGNLSITLTEEDDWTSSLDELLKYKLQDSALTALWQLVDTENVLTVWIDAICINQEDNDERTSQVAMMSSIYQNAEEVVAWLGPDSKLYGVGFEVVDRMASFGRQYYEESWFQWCYRSDVDAEERRSGQYYKEPDGERVPAWSKVLEAAQASLPEWFVPDEPNGNPPSKIFEFVLMGISTFFSRAWIFQELAFSRKARILSGNVSTTLSNLLMAAQVRHVLYAAGEYSAIFGPGSNRAPHWNPGEFADTPFTRSMVSQMLLWDMTNALLSIRGVDTPAVSTPTLSFKLFSSFGTFQATDPRVSQPQGTKCMLIPEEHSFPRRFVRTCMYLVIYVRPSLTCFTLRTKSLHCGAS
jgi:hypothetical protein